MHKIIVSLCRVPFNVLCTLISQSMASWQWQHRPAADWSSKSSRQSSHRKRPTCPDFACGLSSFQQRRLDSSLLDWPVQLPVRGCVDEVTTIEKLTSGQSQRTFIGRMMTLEILSYYGERENFVLVSLWSNHGQLQWWWNKTPPCSCQWIEKITIPESSISQKKASKKTAKLQSKQTHTVDAKRLVTVNSWRARSDEDASLNILCYVACCLMYRLFFSIRSILQSFFRNDSIVRRGKRKNLIVKIEWTFAWQRP